MMLQYRVDGFCRCKEEKDEDVAGGISQRKAARETQPQPSQAKTGSFDAATRGKYIQYVPTKVHDLVSTQHLPRINEVGWVTVSLVDKCREC
jgi:hypothetical protein